MEYREGIAYYDVKQFAKCIAGMAYEKQKALCHPYPSVASKIAAFGYDGKQLSHAARLLIFIHMWYEGMTIEKCYTVPAIFKEVLMNYKKEKDECGNPMSCETAVKRMDDYVSKIKAIKDEIVNSNEYGVNERVKNFLERIKIAVLKQWFLEELKP